MGIVKEVGEARLAQSVERLALNQVVVGSSPTVGASFAFYSSMQPLYEKLISCFHLLLCFRQIIKIR